MVTYYDCRTYINTQPKSSLPNRGCTCVFVYGLDVFYSDPLAFLDFGDP